MNCDVQFFRFSDYSYSPISTRFPDFSDYTILPIVILRFFRSSEYYAILPIFPILRLLRDSRIFDVQFFRFSDYSYSPFYTLFSDFSRIFDVQFFRFSDFSVYTILLIVILRFFRISEYYVILRFIRLYDSSVFFRFSEFYAILRFFRLYDSSDCYSPIFLNLRILRDSPIIRFLRFFPILRVLQ